MLSDLPHFPDARVLVDYRTSDDAGVYALGDGRALVQTVDFFTPIVDDPFAYGEIAAANALSDIYAMGGRPITALAVAAFPAQGFDPADIKAIFAGGLQTLHKAEVALLGGHTVQDAEVKFGYAITGLVTPSQMWTNATARVGDVLLLTKPLGTGIITTALKSNRAEPAALAAALTCMRTLNKSAADGLRLAGDTTVSACTDVTGFGLVGHASEMAEASRVTVAIDCHALPLLPCVRDLALANRSGGSRTNYRHFSTHVIASRPTEEVTEAILFDPQTSGGLLVALAPDHAEVATRLLSARGVLVARIGEILPQRPDGRVLLR